MLSSIQWPFGAEIGYVASVVTLLLAIPSATGALTWYLTRRNARLTHADEKRDLEGQIESWRNRCGEARNDLQHKSQELQHANRVISSHTLGGLLEVAGRAMVNGEHAKAREALERWYAQHRDELALMFALQAEIRLSELPPSPVPQDIEPIEQLLLEALRHDPDRGALFSLIAEANVLLAIAYEARGESDKAEAFWSKTTAEISRALEVGEESAPYIIARAQERHSQGFYRVSMALYDRAIQYLSRNSGNSNEVLLQAQRGRAMVLSDLGRRKEAEAALQQVFDAALADKAIGPDHVLSLLTERDLLTVQMDSKDKVDALTDLHRRMAKHPSLGPHHFDSLACRHMIGIQLGLNVPGVGKRSLLAEKLLQQLYADVVSALGENSEIAIRVRKDLASALVDLGKADEAASELRVLMDKMRDHRKFGPRHAQTLATQLNLAITLNNLQSYEAALAEARDVSKRLNESADFGPVHPDTVRAVFLSGEILGSMGHKGEAEAELAHALGAAERSPGLGPDHPFTAEVKRLLDGAKRLPE